MVKDTTRTTMALSPFSVPCNNKGFPCFTVTDEQRIEVAPKRQARGLNPPAGAIKAQNLRVFRRFCAFLQHLESQGETLYFLPKWWALFILPRLCPASALKNIRGLQLKCSLQRVPIIINDLCDSLFDGSQAVCIVNEFKALFYVKGRPLLQNLQNSGLQFGVTVKAYAADTQNIRVKKIGQQGKEDSWLFRPVLYQTVTLCAGKGRGSKNLHTPLRQIVFNTSFVAAIEHTTSGVPRGNGRPPLRSRSFRAHSPANDSDARRRGQQRIPPHERPRRAPPSCVADELENPVFSTPGDIIFLGSGRSYACSMTI